MATINAKQMKRAYLTDVTLDDIIDHHIKMVTSPTVKYEYQGDMSTGRLVPVEVKEGKPAPRRAILEHKYKFLIHEIITRCIGNKEGKTHLSSANYVSVLGKPFMDMLYTLDEMKIIFVSDTWEIGKSSRSIYLLDWNINFVDDGNIQVLKYVKGIKDIQTEYTKKNLVKQNDSEFAKSYNGCLAKLSLKQKDEALAYIESQRSEYKNEQQYWYYRSRVDGFDGNNLTIIKVDQNHRIYHFLTNLPSTLRRFFNIRYYLDIANCHPLLFSFFLIKKYGISKDIVYKLKEIDKGHIHRVYKDGKQLRKTLCGKGIAVPHAKDLPHDVLLYIYMTMTGQFWDYFMEVFNDMDRGEVKEKLFGEVFYSHSTISRGKTYAKKFVEVYPHVWSVIRQMKKDVRDSLPNKMMKFESKLMWAILGHCFEQSWCVINLHDAIVVLDVPENESLTVEAVEEVMMDVYAKCGLMPTIKVETFNKRPPKMLLKFL